MNDQYKAPKMNVVWNSLGDYEKPHRFAKRLFDVGCSIEKSRDDLLEALQACVDLMRDLPTLNGLAGLAVLEHASDVINKATGAL